MKKLGLTTAELAMIGEVCARHPEVSIAKIFGSRAKGTAAPNSDVDLALWGEIDPLGAEAIAAELDDLPLPYRYDVKAFDSINLPELREHIERVGIVIYKREAHVAKG